MPAALTIADLRRIVAERFPAPPARENGRFVATGVAAFDDALGGGVRAGTFGEIVSGPSCGGQLFQTALLRAARDAGLRTALLDASNGFDGEAFDSESLAHLVWFRGAKPKLFWQAADIVVRDANFSLVIMDVRGVPARELRRTPSSLWYRLQRAIEESGVAVVVQTDMPLVPCAARRLLLSHPLTLGAFKQERAELIASIEPHLEMKRSAWRMCA